MLLRKKLPLRILCLGLVLACCVVSPVQAITWDDVTDTFWLPVDLITLGWHTAWNSDFLTWFDQSESDPGSFMFYWIYSVDNCPDSPLKHPHNPDYARHQFQTDDCTLTELFEGDYSCIYCGLSFKKYREAIAAEADQWTSDLPFGLDASSDGVTAAGSGMQLLGYDTDSVKAFWRGVDLVGLGSAATPGDVMLISAESSINGSSKIWGFVKQHSTVFGVDVLNVYQSFSIAPYTVKDFPVGEFVWFSESVSQKWSGTVFGKSLSSGTTYLPVTACLSYDDALKVYRSGLYTGTKIYFLTSDSYIVPKQLSDGLMTSDYCFTVSEVGHIDKSGNVAYEENMVFRGSYSSSYCDYASYYFFPLDVDVSGDFTEDSRPSGIMDAIQQYNITHNYGDTNVINYYIGSFDEDDNLTGYFPMDIYDEQTLVFTEPVTGAQYQTTGWRYDYAARRYTLDLEPGTFSLGDYDILQIRLTYGDEAVTIQYYNELGQLVETDDFQYVMVAKEQCTLNGHDYSYQTIKEPSCTGTGERLCTCSVCGKETVQEISMLEHTGVYSVFQEATCTASGVGLMTCSRCGTQVSEDIPALGHDWLPVEDVETMYALPDGTSCPACSGVDFTAELDRINEVYSCSCASCGQIWTADAHVQHGYTKYECSRCGKVKTESKSQEDGLFASIGNLIADGMIWCTDKLTQLVDSLTGIVDTFTGYLDSLASTGGAFPSFLALLFSALPEELTALIWLSLVGLVALLVWKKWLG